MSIVLSGSPDTFSPTFNPVVYYPSSNNATLENFSYIAEIYSAGTTSRIAYLQPKPRPVDLLGVIDISHILQSQVDSFFDQDVNGFSTCPENFFNYDIKFGESYTTYFRITGGTQGGTTASTIFNLNLSGNSMPFSADSLVDIVQSYVPYLGTYNALGVTGNTIEVSVNYDIPPSSGFFVWTDRRPTAYTGLTNITNKTIFNGAIPHQEFNSYSGSSFNMVNGGTQLWLTNYPDCYRILDNNCMWWNAYSTTMNTDMNFLEITTPFSQQVFPNTLSGVNHTMSTVNVGPCGLNNLTGQTVSGNTQLFTDTTWSFYDNGSANVFGFTGGNVCFLSSSGSPSPYVIGDVILVQQDPGFINSSYEGYHTVVSAFTSGADYVLVTNVPFAQNTPANPGTASQITTFYDVTLLFSISPRKTISETIRVCLDDRCSSFENIELYFMDRLGAYIPVNCNLNHTEKINIGRNEYQKYLGDLQSNGKYGYASKDKGRTMFGITEILQYDASTNYLTESEGLYLKELFTSPNAYIRQNGEMWPIVVLNTELQLTKKRNKKNFYYNISFQMANNNNINSI